jgi:butyrate kinase
MEKPMKRSRLPKTDSIKQLAAFWDRHDLTDFADQLEEVTEPAFVQGTTIPVPLEADEAEAVARLAQAKGISREALIHAWVRQKVARRNSARPSKRRNGR